jgi:hypothetical protein
VQRVKLTEGGPVNITEKKREHLVFLLTKSPLPARGRIGKKKHQDWYRAVEIGVNLIRQNPNARLLLVTGLSISGEGTEMDCYVRTLHEFGIEAGDMVRIQEGTETVSQLGHAQSYASENSKDLTIVCTLSHAPRVKYLCWRSGLKNNLKVAVLGWPRPREALTDLILAFVFPLVDLVGQREWFLGKVVARRSSGKL